MAQTGDYRRVVDVVDAYGEGRIALEDVADRLMALGLRRHPLGCSYLLMPVPMPPPGSRFDARIMPRDWEGTVGEAAMIYLTGLLSREDWARVHGMLHPNASDCAPTG